MSVHKEDRITYYVSGKAALDTEDGTWVVVDVGAIAGLKVAVVASLNDPTPTI